MSDGHAVYHGYCEFMSFGLLFYIKNFEIKAHFGVFYFFFQDRTDFSIKKQFYRQYQGISRPSVKSYHDKKSCHDKKSVNQFGQHIYHRYIYISRRPLRGTDRQMYKIDKNLPLNEYFPKSIKTKPKKDQGKSYNNWTDRQTNSKTNKNTFMIQKPDLK